LTSSLFLTFSPVDLETLFQMNVRTVQRTLLQGFQQPGLLGRHRARDEESEAARVAMLFDAF
jgi:hypothetical protein